MSGHAYRIVDPATVDMERRLMARRVADWTARHLGISSPEIMWLAPAGAADPIETVTDEACFGVAFARPLHRIGLRADRLHGTQLVSTTAHECWHLAHQGGNEDVADRFGWDVAAHLYREGRIV